MKSFLFNFVLLLSAISASAQINHYYVSPSGSDANDGSKTRPWNTIQHADSALVLGPGGTTVHFAPGTYGSGGVIATRAEGTPSQRITWISDSPLAAIINGDWIVGNNGSAHGGDYNTIQGFTVTSPNTDDGITLGSGGSTYPPGSGGGNFVWILNNYVHDVGTYGSTAGPCAHDAAIGQSGLSHDALIDGNRINRAGLYGGCAGGTSDHGIYLGGYHNTVTNNLVSNVAGAGIQGYHNACENVIANNTVFHNFTGGINLGEPSDGLPPCGTSLGSNDYNSITNNLIVDNAWGCATSTHGSYAIGYSPGNSATHNKATNNFMVGNHMGGSCEPTNNTIASLNGSKAPPIQSGNQAQTSTNGIFVNYQSDGSGDYHLANGSVAATAGVLGSSSVCAIAPGIATGCVPSVDIAGLTRSNPTAVGANEVGSSAESSPTAPTGLTASVK